MNQTSSLAAACLAHRQELRRFFSARLGTERGLDLLLEDLFLKASALDKGETPATPLPTLYRLAAGIARTRLRTAARIAAQPVLTSIP